MAKYTFDFDKIVKNPDFYITDPETATILINGIASRSKVMAIARYEQNKLEQKYHVSIPTINVESKVKEHFKDAERAPPEYWVREIDKVIESKDIDVDAIIIPDLDSWIDYFTFYPSYVIVNRWKDYSGIYKKNILAIWEHNCQLTPQQFCSMENVSRQYPKYAYLASGNDCSERILPLRTSS